MCLGFPAKVTKIVGRQAFVQYRNKKRTVLIGGEPVKVGDFVLVQMGIVIKILSAKEAEETLAIFSID